MNPGSFSTGLRSWPELVRKRHVDTKRGVSLKLFSAVIKDTPVDTGRLRSNWQTSLRMPSHDTSHTLTAEATEKLTTTVAAVKEYDDVYMCNSLPYARRIEYEGWSHTKAPQGMVHRNTERFKRILSGVVSSLKKGGPL